MPEKMLKFTVFDREMPKKRGAKQRVRDFGEIYRQYAAEKAADQAARCSQCGVPFCQDHCPLHNNIPDWLKLTAEGRLREAYELSQATNTFPEICGRICPQDRLCEGSCVIEQAGHGTVTIGAVEKYLTDTAFAEGWVEEIRPIMDRPESVGIVGAGPAGLACADRLRRRGFRVTVYDRHDRPGGLMIYGIPGFKLEKSVVMQRTSYLERGGVTFEQNCEIGTAKAFEDIRADHDALLIATGVCRSRDLDGPGIAQVEPKSTGKGAKNKQAGIVQAIDYLTASDRVGLGDSVPTFNDGTLNAKGRRVVVIGGGDTAMDCVRTAVRQGAVSVKCLYRRDRANMPGSQREVANAEEEGVTFEWLTAPKGFTGDAKAIGIRAVSMRLGPPDASGRGAPEEVPGSEHTEPCDMAIKALGFDPDDLPSLWGIEGLGLTPWGTIKTDSRTHATSLEGVYAAGDIVRGASLVVWAIRDGREAADAIADYLDAESMKRTKGIAAE